MNTKSILTCLMLCLLSQSTWSMEHTSPVQQHEQAEDEMASTLALQERNVKGIVCCAVFLIAVVPAIVVLSTPNSSSGSDNVPSGNVTIPLNVSTHQALHHSLRHHYERNHTLPVFQKYHTKPTKKNHIPRKKNNSTR